MILEQLPSDFYNFQSLLTEQEQQTVAKDGLLRPAYASIDVERLPRHRRTAASHPRRGRLEFGGHHDGRL